MSAIRTGTVARILGYSANTVRAWERRYGFPVALRSSGNHRLYDRETILALKEALDEGYRGEEMAQRAAEILASGRFGPITDAMVDAAMEWDAETSRSQVTSQNWQRLSSARVRGLLLAGLLAAKVSEAA